MLMESKTRKKSLVRRRNKNNAAAVAVKTAKVLGTLALSLFLVIIITGSIFVTVLTIYILNFADVDDVISLDKGTLSSNVSKIMYPNPAYDPDDPDSEEFNILYAVADRSRHVSWVNLDEVPSYVQDAFIAAEDERFMQHDGVDFKRTFSAIVYTLLGRTQGGSTITMQTIKNITREDERQGIEGVERKIKEIFRAINTEKKYTKEDILESYLNIIGMGDGNYDIIGVQAAANYYFGKDITEIDIAEAAALAAIPKEPARLNPYNHLENNRERSEWILKKMLEIGAITDEECERALNEVLDITGDPDFQSRAGIDEDMLNNQGMSSFYVDEAIDEAIGRISERKGITREEARKEFYSGGYNVFTSCDLDMQKKVEKEMLNPANFRTYNFEDDKLESGFICMDLQGNVKAVVGSRFKKTDWDQFDIPVDGCRSPGSCIKPISAYAPALEMNLINYSSIFSDTPITVQTADGKYVKWPVNYSETGTDAGYSKDTFTTWQMLMLSKNTAAAQLIDKLTTSYSLNFLKEKLDITSLHANDDIPSAMAVGGMTNGISLQELTASYMIFGNGGRKYEVTFVNRITNFAGDVIYEKNDGFKQAISESTSYIMNKMMQKVVADPQGTGRFAKLANTQVAAKTGTTTNWKDLTFVAVTPDYVSGLWMGYDKEDKKIPTGQYQGVAMVWKNVFGDVAETEKNHEFKAPATVIEKTYCTKTGLIAGKKCKSTQTGYYKDSHIPSECDGSHN